MKHRCEWCGETVDKFEITERIDWARPVKICKKCSEYKSKHKCVICNMIKPNQILINGVCEDCQEEMLTYRQKEANNGITQLESSQNYVVDSKETIWRNKRFSTNKIQMNNTDQFQQGLDLVRIVTQMVKDQQKFERTFEKGYALKEFGISSRNYQQILSYGDDLQNFLEKHSKKLLSSNNKQYTIVFLDESIESLTDDQRISLEGSDTHFFLLEVKPYKIQLNKRDIKKIHNGISEYLNNFNDKNF